MRGCVQAFNWKSIYTQMTKCSVLSLNGEKRDTKIHSLAHDALDSQLNFIIVKNLFFLCHHIYSVKVWKLVRSTYFGSFSVTDTYSCNIRIDIGKWLISNPGHGKYNPDTHLFVTHHLTSCGRRHRFSVRLTSVQKYQGKVWNVVGDVNVTYLPNCRCSKRLELL